MPDTKTGADVTLIVTLIGVLIPLCIALLKSKYDWTKWSLIPLTAVVSIASLVVVVILFNQVLLTSGEEEQTTAPEESQTAEEAAPLQQAPRSGEAANVPDRSGASEAPASGTPVSQMETRELLVNFGKTNDHCAGPRGVRWHVPANEGWEIDVTSIKVESTVISSKSSYSGVKDATAGGFYIEGRIVNNGDCVRVFGNTVARDGRGTLRVSGTYRETRQVVSALNAR